MGVSSYLSGAGLPSLKSNPEGSHQPHEDRMNSGNGHISSAFCTKQTNGDSKVGLDRETLLGVFVP